jgi:Na+-driven multidrug efflux pump
VLAAACVLAALVSCIIGLARDGIIAGFSDNPDVQALARSIWPWLCFFLFLDATFGAQSGLLRALGLQFYFSLLVFGCLFVLGLPIIAALGFRWGLGWGLQGLWIGMPFSYISLNLAMFVAHRRKDWEAYSASVMAREAAIKAARGAE